MKYCVSGRQPKSILEQADQIKMKYADKERLINYIHDYPNKTFILEIPKNIKSEEIEWKKFQTYNENADFILCIENLNLAKECLKKNIKYYWSYPVFSWYELRGLIDLKPCYIILEAPLSFSLKKVKEITNIPIRLNPNLAYDAYIPRKSGLYGTWIRPEDTKIYSEWVEVFDFVADSISKESTLFHIYKDNQKWLGNLNLLLINFGINVDNRAIPEEIGLIRANCKQRCMSSGKCDFCKTAIKFAETIRKEHEKQTEIKKLNYNSNKIIPIEEE